jgi:MYXO-CTERM domain-containing protein
MIRTLALVSGLSIGVSAAQGAFVGVGFVEGDSAAAAAFAGAGAITFQMFAMFDGAGDGTINTVLSTGFSNIHTIGGGTFFNDNTFGTDLPPSSAFVGLVPALAFDTWGTIGANRSDDPGGSAVSLDPDAAITSTNITGGWFNSNPPNIVGAATANANLSSGFGTLLWNITISTPDAGASVANITSLINGNLVIFEQAPGGALAHGSPAPTPGALGLFGIAGLAGLRRRR